MPLPIAQQGRPYGTLTLADWEQFFNGNTQKALDYLFKTQTPIYANGRLIYIINPGR